MQKKTKQTQKTRTQSLLDEYDSNSGEIIKLSREIANLKSQMIKLLVKEDGLINLIREANDNQK